MFRWEESKRKSFFFGKHRDGERVPFELEGTARVARSGVRTLSARRPFLSGKVGLVLKFIFLVNFAVGR